MLRRFNITYYLRYCDRGAARTKSIGELRPLGESHMRRRTSAWLLYGSGISALIRNSKSLGGERSQPLAPRGHRWAAGYIRANGV